ncbi:PQQ-dependent sugar dehydrogenase [Streptomyces sp. DSM 44915]|uniref:PQQ-dependent sugar dehydrogenase n=1 Tax=Streptomyces chisholmiae TaxID=3075540 RepID=A0ABU2JZH2_9ACTN|nr:PQQ-dependent sugar dehydrogenase [Streptomyces sp. DSM 44915]MDT0270374.1 PQQ-dependent sugar dehydrogenase [Streptomyces sp. DSM 44915]
MGERAGRRRPLARALLAATAGAALLAGCAGGPAADRAASQPTDPETSDTGGTDGQAGGPSEEPAAEEPPPEETAPPAPATGAATPAGAPVEGLDDACCVARLPDGDLLVGARTTGALTRVTPAGEVTPFGQVSGLTGNNAGELLGLAVDPAFEGDGGNGDGIYAFYSGADGNQLYRYLYQPDAEPGAQLGGSGSNVLRNVAAPLPRGDQRNGGVLAFGADGMLYVGTGDAGEAGLADDPDSPAGKILRLEPDGSVPDDQLSQGSPIYSRGHPEVLGMAWDERTELLWSVSRTAEGTVEVASNAPGSAGGDALHSWTTDEVEPAGLALVAGSLWVPSTVGPSLWRLPLAGAELAGAPQELLAGELPAPLAVLPGAEPDELRLLAGGGTDAAGEEGPGSLLGFTVE